MKFFRGNIFGIFAILLLALFGYYYRDSISRIALQSFNRLQPCEHPITYSIAGIDPRFGIPEATLLSDINKATTIWESPVHKQLFAYSPAGDLKISLVYDDRQQATDALQSLGITLNADKASYDAIRAKYDSLVAQYNKEKAQIAALIATYNTDKSAYEKSVNYWNARGGAPKQEYDALQQKRTDLDNQASAITQAETSLNELAGTINSTATILNKLVAELNAQGNAYNTVGASNGAQFQEGEYVSDAHGTAITIFQFDNEDKLVRVLAHEFGHALGLEHLDNPKAIMYYLNEGINEKLTPDDLAALKNVCRIN